MILNHDDVLATAAATVGVAVSVAVTVDITAHLGVGDLLMVIVVVLVGNLYVSVDAAAERSG